MIENVGQLDQPTAATPQSLRAKFTDLEMEKADGIIFAGRIRIEEKEGNYLNFIADDDNTASNSGIPFLYQDRIYNFIYMQYKTTRLLTTPYFYELPDVLPSSKSTNNTFQFNLDKWILFYFAVHNENHKATGTASFFIEGDSDWLESYTIQTIYDFDTLVFADKYEYLIKCFLNFSAAMEMLL